MSDAAYFSAFSEPPLEAHARRLRSIDRERKNVKRQKERREREWKKWNKKGESQALLYLWAKDTV